MRLCICIQYWSGDFERAMRLARHIAALEAVPRDDVRVVMVRRFDALEPDGATIAALRSRFANVECAVSPYGRKGWPDGCNLVAVSAIKWVGSNCDCPALLMEPDCVPLVNWWLDALLAEWMIAAADCWIMGAWSPLGGPKCGHLNGNCVIRSDFASLVDLKIPRGLAWDVAIAEQVQKKWHITGLIKNRFRGEGATEADLNKPDVGEAPPVLLHGYRDDSVWNLLKK